MMTNEELKANYRHAVAQAKMANMRHNVHILRRNTVSPVHAEAQRDNLAQEMIKRGLSLSILNVVKIKTE